MSLTLDKTIPTVAGLLASPLAKYITLAANDCGYSGKAEELIVTYVHPLFLKAHSAASKADNPSWREATRDIDSLGGEGGLCGRVPGGPQVGTANRSQGHAHYGPGQDQGRPLGDQGLPIRLGQARGGQVTRSARQAPGLLDIMLGRIPSHVSQAASAASASVVPTGGYFGMIKRIIEALGLDDGFHQSPSHWSKISMEI